FLQGGGVGKTLAEWIIHGEPETDPWAMDIGRYGKFASNREYIKQTTGQFYSRRFVMTYPNEQLWGGRPLKTSPSYNEMTKNGARWGESWGMEVPIFFGPREFEEIPTLRRSNAFDIVSEECKASRNQVGLLDISGYSRFKVTGINARKWLDWMFASRLPEKGRCRLAPALAKSGRLMGDLVVLNWDDDEWWIMGSYYLREWHMRWFTQNHMENVDVTDISDATLGFSIFGPKSRELLQMVADKDVSNEKFPFMGLESLDIGLIRTKTARVTVTGELGYEINCAAVDHLTLYNILKNACDKIGGREVGFYAVGSLRLEKSFGIWSAEFRNEYTPGEAGVTRWIDFDKGDFIGRSAALEESKGTPKRSLVTLEVKTENSDATGYEPIWHGSRRVGFITSGGYGHTIQKSLAMGYVDTEFSEPGTKLTTHIISEEFPAEVIKPSPHDPMGKRMRS
ncbi:MAG: glycine cleavage system protein T, partial [Paracoccaceae bacterium]|nr:glycine cleavage system protein T [Paracoccaceae bacterium]